VSKDRMSVSLLRLVPGEYTGTSGSRAEQVFCRAAPNFCRFAMLEDYNIAPYAGFTMDRRPSERTILLLPSWFLSKDCK
jgi:hypothetical protein